MRGQVGLSRIASAIWQSRYCMYMYKYILPSGPHAGDTTILEGVSNTSLHRRY